MKAIFRPFDGVLVVIFFCATTTYAQSSPLHKRLKRLEYGFEKLSKEIRTIMQDERDSVLELKKIERKLGPLEKQIDVIRTVYDTHMRRHETLNEKEQQTKNALKEIKESSQELMTYALILSASNRYQQDAVRKQVREQELKHVQGLIEERSRHYVEQHQSYLQEEKEASFQRAHLMDVRRSLDLLQREEALLHDVLVKRKMLLEDISVQKALGVKQIRRLVSQKRNIWQQINAASHDETFDKKLSLQLRAPVAEQPVKRYGEQVAGEDAPARGLYYQLNTVMGIRASAAGKIVFVGRMRGFGQMVIIDHGDRVFSLYAHIAAPKVKQREDVQLGQLIGQYQPEGANVPFYFELRHNGQPINPAPYF